MISSERKKLGTEVWKKHAMQELQQVERPWGRANATYLSRKVSVPGGGGAMMTPYFILVPEEATVCPHIYTVGAQ